MKEIDDLFNLHSFPIQSGEDVGVEVDFFPERILDLLGESRPRLAQNSSTDKTVEKLEEGRIEGGVSIVGVLDDVSGCVFDLEPKLWRHRPSKRPLPRNERLELVNHGGRSLLRSEEIM